MKLSIWDIFKYIFKWKLLIAVSVAVAIAMSVLYTERNQSYDAQVVIKFNDACIKDGKNPKNEEFDPYEIVSPDVVTAVLEDLNLRRSVDGVRSRVKVQAIIPKAEEAMQESMIKDGEEYTYHPDSYSITYSGKIGESPGMVRDILDSIVKNYLNAYVRNYVEQITVNDFTFDEDFGNQDYIEIAEIMSDRIDNVITSLDNYYSRDSSFRSSKTGMTFLDIESEYKHLRDFTIPKIYSNIYEGQITKDKELLLKKYKQRIEEYKLTEKNFSDKAAMTKERLDAFAKANIDVPNSYNVTTENNENNIEIIQGVYDDNSTTNKNVTTTYDDLIRKYVSDSTAVNNARLNAKNCESIVSKFTSSDVKNTDKDALTKQIEEDILYTRDKFNSIYNELHETIEDFNNANATTHLSVLTGVRYYATKSVSIYAILFAGAAVMLSVFFAIAYEIFKAYRKENGEEER